MFTIYVISFTSSVLISHFYKFVVNLILLELAEPTSTTELDLMQASDTAVLEVRLSDDDIINTLLHFATGLWGTDHDATSNRRQITRATM